ncbi:MAG: peptide deformylase [Acutalibacteraceae bacterium]
MAIRNIVKEGDDVLAKVCRPVEKFDNKLATLLDDMAETLKLANGVGLAAPQVGVLRRAVIVDDGEKIIELINPTIIEQSGSQQETEGCLSCPGEWGITQRPMFVTVKAQDRFGKEFTVSGEGLMARAFCHELDHLDGKLFKSVAIRMLDPNEIDS